VARSPKPPMTPDSDNPMSTDTTAPMETEVRACGTCGKTFAAPVCRNPFDETKVLAVARHCGPCVGTENLRISKGVESRRAEAAEAGFRDAWNRICPEEYRSKLEGGNTDMLRLADEQPAFDQITAHPFGARGLILRGGTGAGKTRCMYRLLRSYFLRVPRSSIVAMSAGRFDREARDSAGNFTLSDWFAKLAVADVLFIDDVGKGKWTPATSGQFWELVDDRTKHGKPVFLTTNFSGQRLVEVLGLDGDTSEPLLRRLREHCDVIVCRSNKRQATTE